MNQEKPTSLVIDDDKSICELMKLRLEHQGHSVLTASDGQQAWNLINKNNELIDIIIVDREMPIMDGIAFVRKVKSDDRFKHIPVIMQTSHKEPEKIKEGLEAGVFYYLLKPTNDDVFSSVVLSAQKESFQQQSLKRDLKKQMGGFRLLKAAEFKCKTLEEVKNLACFIANCYPDPTKVISGLSALLINAVEHGNLNIGFDLKSDLLKSNKWNEEIEKRISLPEYKDKVVTVKLIKTLTEIVVTITDQGAGFNWKKYLELNPSRALDVNGRGIALANAVSFDKLTFNESGNSVSARYSLEDDFEW
jgi:two-component system cell cycle response regulator